MINLYYDNIIEGNPVPNGADSFLLTKDARRIPYVKDHSLKCPIDKYTTFYYVMKANKTVVTLYTDKKTTKNLFYPIELNHTIYNWDRPLAGLISSRAAQLIRKNRMKLLILAPRFNGNLYKAERLRDRIYEIIDSGIPKENIYLVTGDINNSYKTVLCLDNVFGIDWWQIFMQLVYRVRFGLSDLDWISPQDKFLFFSNESGIDHNKWNSQNLFNVNNPYFRDHDITLLLDLLYKKLFDKGICYFDLEKYNVKEITNNLIDPKASSVEKDRKIGFFKHLKDYESKNVIELLNVNKEVLENSVVSIICDDVFLNTNTPYKEEYAILSPSPLIWQHIALGHPFMVLGCVDTMHYLNDEGYFSCTSLFTQHYDKIYNPVKRVSSIVKNLEILSSMDKEKLKTLMDEAVPFLKKNQEKFLNKRMQGKFLQLFVDMKYE